MKNLLTALTLSLLMGAVFTLNSCKKETTTEDDSVSAQDASSVMGGITTTDNDASATAGQVSTFSGKTQGLYSALCGISSIDSSNAQQLTITYDGNSDCFGYKRSGSITVALTGATQWQIAGAALSVTYNNFKVTDILSGNTYTISGSHTLTNVSGGLAWKIAYGLVTNDSTVHNLATTGSGMTITFPNGSQRSWTFNRSTKWSSVLSGGSNTITLTNYTTAAGGVDITGTNRYGNTFTNTIITPIQANNKVCDLVEYLAYQGEVQHQVASRTATITYGTNASGTPDGSPTVCGTGFFIQYTNAANGASASRFVPY